MKKISKISLIALSAIVLITVGIFAYKKYQSTNIVLPENIFDVTIKVPNTNISFKYPSKGFYGLGVRFLRANVEPGADMTKIKQIGFEYSEPMDKTKVSEYINFYIGFVTDKGNVDGDYILENAVKSIDKIYGSVAGATINNYVTFNNNKFYISKDNTQNDMEILGAIFLQEDGVYRVTINYLKPNNTLYGKDGDTPESRAAYKNNDELFLEILKNISFK